MMYPLVNVQPTAEEIKKALLPDGENLEALDELIATGQAAFNLIRTSNDLDLYVKSAYFQLEKQFEFFANVVRRKRTQITV